MRPLIGITLDIEQRDNGAWKTYVDKSYQDAVYLHGGAPILLPILIDEAERYAKMLDGILFSGGEDIHPRYFGEEIEAPMDLSPDIRTDFEKALFEAGLSLRKPMLGICLGHQAMNIYTGGNIIQDIPGHKKEGGAVRHEVRFTEGGQLEEIAGQPSTEVNSTHHQSLKRIGDGFVVAATAPDGVIEAIEMPDERFVIGVQWHPEKLAGDTVSERLFAAFISACREKAHG